MKYLQHCVRACCYFADELAMLRHVDHGISVLGLGTDRQRRLFFVGIIVVCRERTDERTRITHGIYVGHNNKVTRHFVYNMHVLFV